MEPALTAAVDFLGVAERVRGDVLGDVLKRVKQILTSSLEN